MNHSPLWTTKSMTGAIVVLVMPPAPSAEHVTVRGVGV